jgi:hypothetical protein
MIDSERIPLAYPVPRAVQVTGLSRSLLYELMKRGELAWIKVGRGASSPMMTCAP